MVISSPALGFATSWKFACTAVARCDACLPLRNLQVVDISPIGETEAEVTEGQGEPLPEFMKLEGEWIIKNVAFIYHENRLSAEPSATYRVCALHRQIVRDHPCRRSGHNIVGRYLGPRREKLRRSLSLNFVCKLFKCIDKVHTKIKHIFRIDILISEPKIVETGSVRTAVFSVT